VSLTEIIIEKIQKDGPITFRDFMEMALYFPGLGYYTSEGERIGENGDFYTSPHYSSLFGQMIARQLEEMWVTLDKQPFTVVEYGAGTGALCCDILHTLQHNSNLYDNLHYCIVEKSGASQGIKEKLVSDKVSCHESISEIPPFVGCVLSNELVDNFSVHKVVMEDELMEVFVDYDNGFVEILKPASDLLRNYFDQLNVVLPKGFRTEINLAAIQWIAEIAEVLQKGFVLTIDYGHPSSDLYHDLRNDGTMVCYYKHRVNYCPYINIGSQDITTHVNFSALHHWGLKNGLEFSGFTNQAYFLLGLGLGSQKENGQTANNIAGKRAQFLQTFLMDMGRKFKVLIQHKGVSRSMLSGLKFNLRLT
jgi:SAM-dependent MidA family methyltransferase